MAHGLEFRHLDVFSRRPFSGNGLIVFFGGTEREADELLSITREVRQFESIFVEPGADLVPARILTVEEELPFAGHPLIGAAAALHEREAPGDEEAAWKFVVGGREIDVVSRRDGDYFAASMNQGPASVQAPLGNGEAAALTASLGLAAADVIGPLQVVSTGLPYLIVPVTGEAIARARIGGPGFESKLASVTAKFVYVLDPEAREGRTWDNAGAVEDVATGSAAGPAAAYLRNHGFARPGDGITIRQGRFTGRPSEMSVQFAADDSIHVGGSVAPVAGGALDPGA